MMKVYDLNVKVRVAVNDDQPYSGRHCRMVMQNMRELLGVHRVARGALRSGVQTIEFDDLKLEATELVMESSPSLPTFRHEYQHDYWRNVAETVGVQCELVFDPSIGNYLKFPFDAAGRLFVTIGIADGPEDVPTLDHVITSVDGFPRRVTIVGYLMEVDDSGEVWSGPRISSDGIGLDSVFSHWLHKFVHFVKTVSIDHLADRSFA